ncbi:hypothetical protein SB861_49655 [Paraburkholderia sp. SIMBA_049]
MASVEGHSSGADYRIWEMTEVMADVIVEAEIDVGRECATDAMYYVSDRGRSRRDRIFAAAFQLLMDPIESVGNS